MSANKVKEVISQWALSFANPTAEDICALYIEEAVLLGTLSPFYRDTPELIKEYFDGLFELNERSVEITEIYVKEYSGSATCTGFYTFHWDSSGQQIDLDSRFTFVLEKQSEDWLIAHHHSSSLPKNHISVCSDS